MARDLSIVVEAQTAQAEEALGRVERALQGVEQAAVPADKNLDALGQHAPDVRSQFDQMRASLERTETALKNTTDTTKKAVPVMSGLVDAVKSYIGPAVVGLAIKQTLEFADHIQNLSKQTGIAPDKLQQLGFAAKQVGIQIDPLVASIGQMSDRLASGDKSAVGALQRLGLSFDVIRAMSPDKAFIAIAEAIAGVPDPMEQARDATDLFGRTGLQLLPMFTKELRTLLDEAKRLGLVMENETTKGMSDLNSQLSKMLDVGKQLLVTFFMPLVPALNAILSVLTPVVAKFSQLMDMVFHPMDVGYNAGSWVMSMLGFKPPAMAGMSPVSSHGQTDWSSIGDYMPMSQSPNRIVRGSGVPPGKQKPERLEKPYLQYDDYALYNAGFYNAFPPREQSGFANWTIPSAPLTPYASYGSMTATPNRPQSPGLFSGAAGRFLSAGLGALTSFIPGLSGQGSMIGSSFGSALGSVKGIAGALGSFAPMLGPIAGIAGGLLGKLFGGGEGKKTKDARNSFISDFGGMAELQKVADKVGFSLDKMLSTQKVADFQNEVQRLKDAMGAYDDKVKAANDELDGMKSKLSDTQGELDGVLKKASDMGYNFDKSGNLVSVNFRKMQEVADKYKISIESLGPAFQQQRLSDMAQQIIDDFTLLNKGGTDTGTILSGMSPKISDLVNQSIRYGTEIPANMKPWIENLIQAGLLTDANGNKITDLTNMKFGAPVATEYEKIQTSIKELITKMGDLIGKIGEMTARIDEMTRPRTIDIGFNVAPEPDLSGVPGYTEDRSMGGLIGRPKYLAAGGFVPRGTDTVPAMLTPGEGVLRRDAVSRLMRGDWPQGGGSMSISIDNITVGSFESDVEAETQMGRALVRGLKRRGVRLQAA